MHGRNALEKRIMLGLNELRQSIIDGNSTGAVELTESAIAAKIPAQDILDKGLFSAMDTVGRLFNKGEYFFPEMLLAGAAMKSALEQLKPFFSKGKASYSGRFTIGTVQGDIHGIGKNIVIMMLEANGWLVTDLGTDVPSERFCQAVRESGCDILGMSALLTLTMPRFKEVIDALTAAGLRDGVKIIVGGAPVTQAYADQVGADGYARDAVAAVIKAKDLIKAIERG